MSYNGWNNYETWSVALWIDNDYGLSEVIKEWNAECDSDYQLAQCIEEFFTEEMPELDGLWSQLLHAAMSEVNWLELAEHYYEETNDESDGGDE